MKKLIALFAFFVLLTAASFAATTGTNTFTLGVQCPSIVLDVPAGQNLALGTFTAGGNYVPAANNVANWTITGHNHWGYNTATTTKVINGAPGDVTCTETWNTPMDHWIEWGNTLCGQTATLSVTVTGVTVSATADYSVAYTVTYGVTVTE
jgi:hypothetical protein